MKYLRRIIWFVCTRLLIACCVLGLMITVFYYAMNASNIYMILKDGMAKRAQVIMMGKDPETLEGYFADSYLQSGWDQELRGGLEKNNLYQYYYDITGFDHRIELKWVWNWPWEDVSQATFIERIPAIDGKIRSAFRGQTEALAIPSAPPAWTTVKYAVTLNRKDDRWKIVRMEQLEIIRE